MTPGVTEIEEKVRQNMWEPLWLLYPGRVSLEVSVTYIADYKAGHVNKDSTAAWFAAVTY